MNEREAMIKGARSKGIYTTSVKRLMPIMEREGYTWGTCPECGGKGHIKCGICPAGSPKDCDHECPDCPACNGHGKRWVKNG